MKPIEELISRGDTLAESFKFEEALQAYRDAVSLVPDPFHENGLSTILLTSIGDIYFLMGDFRKAEQAFNDVLLCPGVAANEHIRLRRGQIAYELGDQKKATLELVLAFMNGGLKIFEGEDQKYLTFISADIEKLK